MGGVECEGMMQEVGWHSAELGGYEGEGGVSKMKAGVRRINLIYIISFFIIGARNF